MAYSFDRKTFIREYHARVVGKWLRGFRHVDIEFSLSMMGFYTKQNIQGSVVRDFVRGQGDLKGVVLW